MAFNIPEVVSFEVKFPVVDGHIPSEAARPMRNSA